MTTMSTVIKLFALLVATATALRPPPVGTAATRRAVLGSALSCAALPHAAFADTIEEIAAASNAEADKVRAAKAMAAEKGPGFGKTISDAGVVVAFLALASGAYKMTDSLLREPCAPLADECDIASYEVDDLDVIDALDGWEKVPSRSRPGQFSFKNLQTGDVYEKIPAAVKYRVKFG